MRSFEKEAIVLRCVNYGDSDRIVSFLTENGYFISGYARSARRSRKRFGSSLEPFSRVSVTWEERANSTLVSLKQCDLLNLHMGLRKNLTVLSLAGYGCELLATLFPDLQENTPIYQLLLAFIEHLDGLPDNLGESRLLLELRLLHLSGHMPHLLHCSCCNYVFSEGDVCFAATAGGSLCADCSQGREMKVAVLTLGSLARCLRGPLTRFSGVRLSEKSLQEGLAIISEALKPHLARPLKSLQFLEQLQTGV